MTFTQPFQYDVAFSFVAQDEVLATKLADYFEGRLRVFLYSRRQEKLAGTDGEKSFNDVFANQSRLVVVLYRDEWGQSPWTRIEETAIRNRAFEKGYGFVMFIPLDVKPNVPEWLPRTQLWVGLNRWGISGAASVIDARIQELGGEPTEETLEHRAVRVERALIFSKTRDTYCGSDVGVRGANEAFEALRDAILDAIPRLQAAAPSLAITEKHVDKQIVLLSSGPALLVAWRFKYINTLNESSLEVSIWRGHPPYPGIQFLWEQPSSIATMTFLADLTESGEAVWTTKSADGPHTLNSQAASDYILNWWLAKTLKAVPGRDKPLP